MKILISASQSVEIDVPEDIDPDDLNDFVVDEIREVYLGEWDLQGWQKVHSSNEEAIANA